MIAVALRGLLSRKLRTALTMIAIVLGVAMIAGTYILTDTINTAFSQIFHQSDRATDAVITGKAPFTQEFATPPTLPSGLLAVVRQVPGVAAADGEIAGTGQLFTPRGQAIGSVGGAPTLLVSRPPARFHTLILVNGHEPGPGQILVDTGTANRHHFHLGQRVGIVASRPMSLFTIVGITRFSSGGSLGGASLISMNLRDAQRIMDKKGRYDQIAVISQPGVTQAEIVQRIKQAIPPGLRGSVEVRTSEQYASDQAAEIGRALNFLTIALLAFGGIAVFVGAFIIFNTFSITVAQRTRELALLRTLGATRGQVLRSIMLEALVVGLVSSLLGLLAGIGLAKALNSLFISFGIDLPSTASVIATRTVVVSLLVGTVITLASSLWPAVRSTRVPPVAALREGFQLPRGRFARFAPYLAVLLAVAGVALLAGGVFGSISDAGQRLSIIGFGAVVLFLGVAMISPQLVRPLADLIGWPVERLTRITGRLARENATRNPGRTATTAASLMIGLALVGFVTIFATELKQTVTSTINRQLVGDFAIDSQQQQGMPQGVGAAVARVPGVAVVSSLKQDAARLQGDGTVTVNAIQPQNFGRIYTLEWKDGSPATLTHMGPHDAIVDDNFASSHHLRVGSTVRVLTTARKHEAFRVVGIYKNTLYLSGWAIPYSTMARDWSQPQDIAVVVLAAPGQNLTTIKKRIEGLLKRQYPSTEVLSQADIKSRNEQNVNQLLALIYVLLAMSVLVSLFGIINTLVLSVYERTREIGMLRAIGATRTQIRWMIRWESVITAVIGALLGLVLGIVLAFIVTAGLQSQGIEYALPLGQLLIWVVFAIVFGIVAAAFPARRAARLNVLEAVSYE